MGCPKNSTRARRILIAKTPTHRLCRMVQDWAEDWAEDWVEDQDDFKEQKSLLQELYENAGHLCLYYPKFHCELNFIEQYWGNAKFRYRETPLTTNDNEMIKNMWDCLDAVPVESIRSYSIRSCRFMDGYRAGLDGPQAAWACRKYHGHRTLPPDALWEARSRV